MSKLDDDICKFGYYMKISKVYKGIRFWSDGSYSINPANEYVSRGATTLMIDTKKVKLMDIIATLFVENPNGYRYIIQKGNYRDYSNKNLQWVSEPTSSRHKPVQV